MILNYEVPAGQRVGVYLTGTGTIYWDQSNNTIATSVSNTVATLYDHTYNTAYRGTIVIAGNITQFGGGYRHPGIAYLRSVSQFNSNLTSLSFSFFGATGFTNNNSIPTNIPSSVTNLSSMFLNSNFNDPNISSWDVSQVKDMGFVFVASSFNQDISDWDVSQVTTMVQMFGQTHFNQDISDWDVSKVTDMGLMFLDNSDFNQDISDWDVSKVTQMSIMFRNASSFNQDISDWDVSKVTAMFRMFRSASSFNQDIGRWNSKVSKVTDMSEMFLNASSFNQNLSEWNVSKVNNMNQMFSNTSLSTINSNAILNGWASLPSVISRVQLESTFYSSQGVFGYYKLSDPPNKWTIYATRVTPTYTTSAYQNVPFTFTYSLPYGNPILGHRYDLSYNSTVVATYTCNNSSEEYTFLNVVLNTLGSNIPLTIFDTTANVIVDSTISITVAILTEQMILNYDVPAGQRVGFNLIGNGTIFWDQSNRDISSNVSSSGTPGLYDHTYNTAYNGTIVIYGNITQFGSPTGIYPGIAYLKSVSQFNSNLTSLSDAFSGATGFTNNNSIPTNIPSSVTNLNSMFLYSNFNDPNIRSWDVELVTNMSYMFWEASTFNQNIGSWKVDRVTNMASMFSGASVFNQDISDWDVSQVKDMNFMFYGASAFNQNIGRWNVSEVTNMAQMFCRTHFNQDISDWDVSQVKDMNFMFLEASAFNQNIGRWDVSKVTDMYLMFYYASSFNQNLSKWDVSKVTNMAGMFYDASSFNQNLSKWNVSNVNDMGGMFYRSSLSTINSNAILNGWASLPSVISRVWLTFNFYSSQGVYGYNTLRSPPNNWTINATRVNPTYTTSAYQNVPFTFIYSLPGGNPILGHTYDLSYNSNVLATYTCISSSEEYTFLNVVLNTLGSNIPLTIFDTTADVIVDRTISITVNSTPMILNYDVPAGQRVGFYLIGTGTIFWDEFNRDISSNVSSSGTPGLYDHTYTAAYNGTIVIDGNITQFGSPTGIYPGIAYLKSVSQFNSNLTSLSDAFRGATHFTNNNSIPTNIPSSVTNLSNMFFKSNFNDPIISGWNVELVTNMSYMFRDASTFNQDIGSWKVDMVSNMAGMFSGASAFNQDIGSWKVDRVNNMSYMFRDASTFNQDIGGWKVDMVTNMAEMFTGDSALSTINFNSILNAWATQNVQKGVALGGGTSYSSQGLPGYNRLSVYNNWTINSNFVTPTYSPTLVSENTPFVFKYSLPNGNPILGHTYDLIYGSSVLAIYTCINSADTVYTFSNVFVSSGASSSIAFTIFDITANVVVDSTIYINIKNVEKEGNIMRFGRGSNSNGQFWYGGEVDFPGFLYKKNPGAGGSKSTKFGAGGNMLCNKQTYLYNKYTPGDDGVGATTIANRRSKNRLSSVCSPEHTCGQFYNYLGLYDNYTSNPDGYINPNPK